MSANEIKVIKVFIKIRPLIAREKNENAVAVWQVLGNTLRSTDKQHEMSFGKYISLLKRIMHLEIRQNCKLLSWLTF